MSIWHCGTPPPPPPRPKLLVLWSRFWATGRLWFNDKNFHDICGYGACRIRVTVVTSLISCLSCLFILSTVYTSFTFNPILMNLVMYQVMIYCFMTHSEILLLRDVCKCVFESGSEGPIWLVIWLNTFILFWWWFLWGVLYFCQFVWEVVILSHDLLYGSLVIHKRVWVWYGDIFVGGDPILFLVSRWGEHIYFLLRLGHESRSGICSI